MAPVCVPDEGEELDDSWVCVTAGWGATGAGNWENGQNPFELWAEVKERFVSVGSGRQSQPTASCSAHTGKPDELQGPMGRRRCR